MPNWKLGKKDLEFLEDIAGAEIKLVAQRRKITEGAARAWLHRIRKRIERYRWYINNIQNLQKKYPRIRKLTTRGNVREEDRWDWKRSSA